MQYVTGSGAPPMGFGSFHQQYFLDGKSLLQNVITILVDKFVYWACVICVADTLFCW